MPPAQVKALDMVSVTPENIVRMQNYLVVEHGVPVHMAVAAIVVAMVSAAAAATAMIEDREGRVHNAQHIAMMLNRLWKELCQ